MCKNIMSDHRCLLLRRVWGGSETLPYRRFFKDMISAQKQELPEIGQFFLVVKY